MQIESSYLAGNQHIQQPASLTCKLVIRSVQLSGVRQALVTVFRLHFPRVRRNAELFGDPQFRWKRCFCRCPSRTLPRLWLNHSWCVINQKTRHVLRAQIPCLLFFCARPRAWGAEWATHASARHSLSLRVCHAHVHSYTYVHTRVRERVKGQCQNLNNSSRVVRFSLSHTASNSCLIFSLFGTICSSWSRSHSRTFCLHQHQQKTLESLL